MANPIDQPTTWTNRKSSAYESLWSATVTPWTLEQTWLWENVADDIDNLKQDEQN